MVARKKAETVARGGFTLMEMLVVVAILVVLAGAAVPIYMRHLDDAKKDRARIDVKLIGDTLRTYQLRHGEFPASLQVLTQPTADGGLPYLEEQNLFDPWGHEYQYSPEGQHNAHVGKPDVWSLGPKLNDPNGIIGNWAVGAGAGGL